MANFPITIDKKYLAQLRSGSWIRFSTIGLATPDISDSTSQDVTGKSGDFYYKNLTDLDDGLSFTLAASMICYLKDITSAPETMPQPEPTTGSVVPYVLSFSAMGYYLIGTGIDGVEVVPWAGAISGVYLTRAAPGTSGSTTVDLNKNGTTVYTTQGNRPSIAYNDADLVVAATLPDVVSVAVGDVLTFDIDAMETGGPGDLKLKVLITPAF